MAAMEVPEVLRVGRGGPGWRDALAGPPVRMVPTAANHVRLTPASQPRVLLTARVRAAVGRAVERLLGMERGSVAVLIDGVGA